MERYEAILEQLKKAQGRGMETITNRLDFVVQSLEELIQEAKTSVQGALPKSAEEFLPVDEVEAALNAFRDEARAERERASKLNEQVEELERIVASGGQSASLELMRSLDGAASQSELLRELLPVLSENAARAVVLVIRESSVSAWSGIGFADGEKLRTWHGWSSTHFLDARLSFQFFPFGERSTLPARFLNPDGEVVTELTPEQIRAMIADGSIAGGMIPKTETALGALEGDVRELDFTLVAVLAQSIKGDRHIGVGNGVHEGRNDPEREIGPGVIEAKTAAMATRSAASAPHTSGAAPSSSARPTRSTR